MKASEVLRVLRISRGTLSKYVKEGKIKTLPSCTSWNEYDDNDVYSLINKKERKVFIYARVSTSKQKKDLENQIESLKLYSAAKGYKISGIYKDIASGISFDKRKDFMEMLEYILKNEVEKVIVSHKDRLSRVGFDLFKSLFSTFGCNIEVVYESYDKATDEKEIFEEIVYLLHCYSMKMYSKRRGNVLEISDSK